MRPGTHPPHAAGGSRLRLAAQQRQGHVAGPCGRRLGNEWHAGGGADGEESGGALHVGGPHPVAQDRGKEGQLRAGRGRVSGRGGVSGRVMDVRVMDVRRAMGKWGESRGRVAREQVSRECRHTAIA